MYCCRLFILLFLRMVRPNVLSVAKSWKAKPWLHVTSRFILVKSLLCVVNAIMHQIKGWIWRDISIVSIVKTFFCKVNKIGIFNIVVTDYRANYSWEWRFPMSFVSKNHENQKLFWKSHQDSYWWKALCLLCMRLCGIWQIKFKETY